MLCPKCLGENDEELRSCQPCGKPSDTLSEGKTPVMPVDDKPTERRAEQIHTAVAALASFKSTDQVSDLFNSFLKSCARKRG